MWAQTLDVTTAVAVTVVAVVVVVVVAAVVVVAVAVAVTIARTEMTDRDVPSRVSLLPAAVHRQTRRLRPSASACAGVSVMVRARAASVRSTSVACRR